MMIRRLIHLDHYYLSSSSWTMDVAATNPKPSGAVAIASRRGLGAAVKLEFRTNYSETKRENCITLPSSMILQIKGEILWFAKTVDM
jgi:hypothetical protein